ncbi:hypothetical protein Anapl_12106 [Anas platyrhynchos]|uniref:Uncharacterized protein n=1 Tax=Anas platyrhynchos TaxID=8839 RepID=R0LN86_ANAPL|nr:hypothetical protein Anapl_12106 [Anas platyrhynchos]
MATSSCSESFGSDWSHECDSGAGRSCQLALSGRARVLLRFYKPALLWSLTCCPAFIPERSTGQVKVAAVPQGLQHLTLQKTTNSFPSGLAAAPTWMQFLSTKAAGQMDVSHGLNVAQEP